MPPFFRTELQLFLLLNLAVASIQNKKHSRVTYFKKQVQDALQKMKHVDKDSLNIIEVLQKFSINQHAQGVRPLEVATDGTYEKEFL